MLKRMSTKTLNWMAKAIMYMLVPTILVWFVYLIYIAIVATTEMETL